MNTAELISLLNRLRAEPHEAEWLEFKRDRHVAQDVGEYLSALANSTCLLGKPRGYLVFGIDDKTYQVVGTSFNPAIEKGKGNQSLELWLSLGLQPNVGFMVHPFEYEGKRVVLFEVNPAFDRPVRFYGVPYVRVGSSKVELSKHPDKERRIWQTRVDWSAEVCQAASLADLDPTAITKARLEYRTKYPAKSAEIEAWDDVTFLNKTKLTIQGGITRAALLLLGNPESASLLAPAVAKISWILKDAQNREKDYEHFGPPLLVNVDKVLAKIRNLTLRQLPSGTLFPREVSQYDPWVIREGLHNCIAHQDYGLRGRINVVETPDSLLLSNVGSFLPGDVDRVIHQDAPQEVYRNPFLAEAMVNLNMIDTQGGGIKRMFQAQWSRSFPLPDYDLSSPERVVVQIGGRVLDEKYTKLLMERTDLDLEDIVLLDKVQKRRPISRDQHQRLKGLMLVEGRYPNLLVAGPVAAATGGKAHHILDRGLNNQYYRDLIVEIVREHQPVARKDVDELLMDKLPQILVDKQKRTKISNLLRSLVRDGRIRNVGSRRYPKWELVETGAEDE